MLGTFTYHNPTKLHFGSDSLSFLPEELAQFGPNVVLAYGGGSIKRNGVYDQFIGILHDAGKSVTEIAGVMPNPAEKLKIGHVFASSDVMPRFPILNRYIMDARLPKFVRFATNVWDVDPAGKSDEQIAEEGLAALEAWMKKLELPLNLNELGAGDADLDDLVNATIILEGGYKTFTEEDVRTVLEQCF